MKVCWSLQHYGSHGERLSPRKGEFHGRGEKKYACISHQIYLRLDSWWFYMVPVYRATISLSHASVRCQSWLMHRWCQPQTWTLSHTQPGGDSLASLHTIIFRLNLKNYMKTSKCEVAYLTVSDVSPWIPVQMSRVLCI